MIKLSKTLFCFIVSVVFPFVLFGQNKSVSDVFHEQFKNKYAQIDSLMNRINHESSDTARIRLYHIISTKCKDEDALKYGEPMLALCDKLIKESKDVAIIKYAKKEKIAALRAMTNRYGFNADKNLEILNKCLVIFKELDDKIGIVDTKIDIASMYANQGNIMKQLLYLNDGLKITKETGDKRGTARFIRQLQILYANQGDTAQALNYLNKGLLLEKEIGDPLSLARGYFLSGNVYSSIRRYNEAIYNYKKAIDRYTANKNVEPLPEILIEMGKTFTAKKEYTEGIKYLKLAYETAQRNENPERMFFSLISLGLTYAQQGDFKNGYLLQNRFSIKKL